MNAIISLPISQYLQVMQHRSTETELQTELYTQRTASIQLLCCRML